MVNVKTKIFCEQCGLKARNYDPDKYKCVGCEHVNFKKNWREKIWHEFETCEKCLALNKGELTRKQIGFKEYEFKCSCGNEWKRSWTEYP